MTDITWLATQMSAIVPLLGSEGTMTPPEVKKLPTEYNGDWPAGNVIEGGIVHSMAQHVHNPDSRWGPVGTFHAADWLAAKKYSAHCLIEPDGTILETVSIERQAYHAGKSAWRGRESLNGWYLGCEFLVKGEHGYGTFLDAIAKPDCYSDEQYNSGGFLYAYWNSVCPHFDRARILGHSLVAGDEVRGEGKGKRDPGDGFDWIRFLERYDAWARELMT